MFRHRACGDRRVAGGLHRVDLDQLAVDREEVTADSAQDVGADGFDRLGETRERQKRCCAGEKMRIPGQGAAQAAGAAKKDCDQSRFHRIMPFMPRSIRCRLPPRIIFIILRICSNWVSRRFTSWTCTPAPDAMRRLREALRISGLRRSCGVIELMIASVRLS